MEEKVIKRINDLIQFLNYHTDLYEQGKPEISDLDWDKRYFELQNLENSYQYYSPNSPTQKILYTIKDNLPEVEHSSPMLSADKTKDWNTFLQYFDIYHDVCGMPKLDGLTLRVTYKNGKIFRAETRGNGLKGSDVTHNAYVIPTIPNKIDFTDELIVDGEIICTDKDFEPFQKDYANSRNFAAGSIKLLDSQECRKRNLTFVVWNCVQGLSENSFWMRMTRLQKLGFYLPPMTSSFDWDAKEFLIAECQERGLPIDGLIGRYEDIEFGKSLGRTEHHYKDLYAFKFFDEATVSTLLNIEFEVSRNGVLTPVAVIKPVNIDGAICTKASLHNLSVMNELLDKPKYNQLVSVIRSNMVIPTIVDSVKTSGERYIKIPTKCPCCETKLVIEKLNDSEVLKCPNENCECRIINQLDHFCGKDGLNIKGLSKATLEKLIDWGWINTISDIFNLMNYKNDWIKKEGFGEKSVGNILTAIENSKNCRLDQFIAALGIPLIGKKVATLLAQKVEDYTDFRKKVKDNYDWSSFDTFGEQKSTAINSYNYEEADKIAKILIFKKNNDIILTENKSLTFCITGLLTEYKNRDELIKDIEKIGAKVTTSISKKTTALINNDINSLSAKNKKANEYKIPIISEKDFIKKYLQK